MQITGRDRERLRRLAQEQYELSQSDAMRALRGDWERHGAFDPASRPMILIELGTFEQDIIPPLLACASQEARNIERALLRNIVNHTLFGDDTVVRDHFVFNPRGRFIPFGLAVKRHETGGVGHQFVAYLQDLEADYEKLGPSTYTLDVPSVEMRRLLEDTFGDILPVKETGTSLVSSPTQDIVHIMHMEDMFVAMYDTPELFHRMMERLCDDYLAYFRWLEAQGALHSAKGDEHLCQGAYCFSDELAEKNPAALSDMWLYMDSQETSGVSPQMYAQFVFPYYRRLMDVAGCISYGCCEAVDAIWDGCLSQLPNLRKVSISPWCDEPFMGERLAGRKTVYLRKPSPNYLGVGVALDEDAVRRHIRATAEAARGCTLQIAQRDVYRISNTPDKVRQYVTLIREEIGRHWRPA